MNVLLVAAFILTVWELLGRPLPRFAARSWPILSTPLALLAAALLVGGFSGQLELLAYQSGHDGLRPAWLAQTPFLFVDDGYPFAGTHSLISLAALGLVLVQTAGLFGLVAVAANQARASRFATTLIPVSIALMAALSLAAPAVSSGDVFGYVGLGMLGAHAYERPLHFFTGEYARVFNYYPLRPTIYGPLWVALNALVVALGTSFAAKVLALRAFGVVLLAALLALARALGISRAALTAIALCPMLWLQFVVNAHNDLQAVDLVALCILLVARNRPRWAVVALACAGLIKFPFVLMGSVAFAREGARRAFGYAFAAAGLCFVLSAIFGGSAYLDSLLRTVHSRGVAMDSSVATVQIVLVLSAAATVAAVLALGRFPAFGGWLYPALAPLLFPWYLVWVVPYALASGIGLVATMLALPVLATLSETIYRLDEIALVLPAAAVAALVLGIRGRSAGARSTT